LEFRAICCAGARKKFEQDAVVKRNEEGETLEQETRGLRKEN
jgi:hypothetical protein